MKVQVQDLGKLRREMQIEIPLTEIRGEYQNVKNQVRNTRLRGFRPGKFPKGWLQSRFRGAMSHEIQERLFPQYYSRALQQEQLTPAVQPSLLNVDFDENKPLQFKVEFEIAPSMPELDYSQLKLEVQDSKDVTDEDIEKMILQLRRARSIRQPKEGGVVESGDLVTFDAHGTLDGEALPESEQIEHSEFEVGGEFFPEFSDAVLGMQPEETKTVSLELGSTFQEDLRGKTAEFEIKVHSIETLTLPEMDGEFFQTYGHQNEDELRNAVKEMQVQNQKSQQMQSYREELQSQLVAQLKEIDLPESLQQRREEALRKESESNGEPLSEEDITKQMEEFRDSLRLDFLVSHLFRTVPLELDEPTLSNRFANAAGMMGLSAQELYDHRYGQMLINEMISNLRKEQALDHVVEQILGPQKDGGAPEESATTEETSPAPSE